MPGTDDQLTFSEFELEDFDAYQEEKWNSNMFTLQRRKVKGKLEDIGRSLNEELNADGLSLTMHLSDEFPSLWNKKNVDTQWLFFSRDEAARAELTDLIDTERTFAGTLADPTPLYRHVFLGVAVNKDYLEIGLRLHHDAWVDRQNLLNLLKEPDGRLRMKELLSKIPEHYEAGLSNGETARPSSFDETEIEKLTTDFEDLKGWLFVGARLPKDQVLVLGSDVVGIACEVFRYLLPVYRFFAWSADNDAISLDRLVAERNEALRASREELDRERSQREADRKEKQEQGLKLREEIEEKFLKEKAWREREQAARWAAAARAASAEKHKEAKARAESLAAKWNLDGEKSKQPVESPDNKETAASKPVVGAKRPDPEPSESRQRPRRRERKETPVTNDGRRADETRFDTLKATTEINVGDLIEVKQGFLKGRRGTVQEIDEKGVIKVVFGALSSRLTRDDVLGFGPAPADRRFGNTSFKNSRQNHNAPRRHFRAKLQADRISNSKKSGSQTNKKTGESFRSREGK
ncbi:MAG: hypothetical protein GY847_28335 [Proteobacteria bacterium]|nr:hypothetical protein [Pseudomonadota bacterium]